MFERYGIVLLSGTLLSATALAEPAWFDPTRPLRPSVQTEKKVKEGVGTQTLPKIQGILRRDGRNYLLVDGKAFGAGQLLHGYRVLSVDRKEARLMGPNGKLRLPLEKRPKEKMVEGKTR